MQYTTLALVWAVVAWVIYKYVNSILEARAFKREEIRRGCKPPPVYPTKWPFGIDNVYQAVQADRVQKFPEFVDNRFRKMNYRTHRYHIMGGSGIATADPKIVQAILATQFNEFATGSRRRGNFLPLLGSGIFTTDGKMWEHSRALLRPQFARHQVADLDLEENHIQDLMQAIPVHEGGWTNEVDLSVLFFRLTIDSATEFLFGESVNSQLQNIPGYAAMHPPKSPERDEVAFTYAFDNGQRMLSHRARFQGVWWAIDSFEFRRNCRTVHNFIDSFVREALEKGPTEKDLEKASGQKPKYVFLDALIKQTRDPLELRSQLQNILLAGRDTTAGLLGWTFWELARKPDVFNKLRAAILADFGEYNDLVRGETITFEKLKSCTYLQHVLSETLRVHTVVPFNWRTVVNDYVTLPRGGGEDGESPILMKKGESVEYSINVMQRLKSIWGEDAEEFRPERWVGRKPGWEYLPFNGGPRICLGQQFALTEASYVTVRLMQRFDTIQNLDFNEMTHNLTLTSSPGGGVRVRLHQAK